MAGGDAEGKKPDVEDPEAPKKDFVPSEGLTEEEATQLIHQWGRNELEEKVTPKWLIFLKQLWGPMPVMIWIAIVIELAIENWLDAGILIVIQFANATIGWHETTKAGDAVAALKASLKPIATVKRDGTWKQMDARMLVPGDLVLLGSGSSVPADCIVNDGRIDVDQSALTGESLPVAMKKGSGAKMGSTVTRGEVEATVESTGKHTFFGKTATMIQTVGAGELGNLQKILLRIMGALVCISLTLCLIALIYLLVKYTRHEVPFKEALSFVVVLLIASIPIAIEIVTTCTLALGSRRLAQMHAIVTRLIAIEEMAGMNMLCSDKTGTLTLNKMVIQDDCPVFAAGYDMKAVLQNAALAAKWKEPPRDALDTMILGSADIAALEKYEMVDYMPFDPAVKRTQGTLRDKETGQCFKTTKGAPHIILNLCSNKHDIESEVESKVTELGLRGIRSLGVARAEGHDPEGKEQWLMLGILTFLDPPRPDTKETIHRAMQYGVGVKMITGDQIVIAAETARTLGMGTNIKGAQGLPSMTADGQVPKDLATKYGKTIIEADGFAQVFPEHKYLIVETLRQCGYAVGMTGDGVNDAPALKRADVGIAVSGATDAARAAADIVITSPGLSVVVEAIIIARCIFQRVKSFINYRVAATLQLLCFFFIAVFAFEPRKYQPEGQEWPVFFQLPVIMLMLITLLNDGTLISIGYDHVIPSQNPEKWNLKVLFIVSSVLAGVACISSLLLLYFALTSHRKGSVFSKFGLPSMPYGKIVTMIYLKVSLSDFLTLFSSRTQGFFFVQRPGKLLFFGCVGSLTISTILANIWPRGKTDKIRVQGLATSDDDSNYKLWAIWVWLYCIVWWAVQDIAKVLTWTVIYKFNIFNANAGRTVAMTNEGAAGPSHSEPDHDVVTVSYNKNTGAAMAEKLKEQLGPGQFGKEVGAKFEEGEDGEVHLSVSYSKQQGKALAEQLRAEIAKSSGQGGSTS